MPGYRSSQLGLSSSMSRIFPGSIIFLQLLFTPDRVFCVIELFVIDQLMDTVSLGKSLRYFQFVLANAPDLIIGHADVQRAADVAGEDVNVEAPWLHLYALEYWVARSSRAMTVLGWGGAMRYSPACSLRGRGNSSGAPGLTRRGVSSGASVLEKSSSSIRPARFSILSAEIRICRTSSLAWEK